MLHSRILIRSLCADVARHVVIVVVLATDALTRVLRRLIRICVTILLLCLYYGLLGDLCGDRGACFSLIAGAVDHDGLEVGRAVVGTQHPARLFSDCICWLLF